MLMDRARTDAVYSVACGYSALPLQRVMEIYGFPSTDALECVELAGWSFDAGAQTVRIPTLSRSGIEIPPSTLRKILDLDSERSVTRGRVE